MRILVSGSSGLIGSALRPALVAAGHEPELLVRGDGDKGIPWAPPSQGPSPDALAGLDAVVHLAGENIAARRWSAGQKQCLRESRVQATHVLCESLANMKKPPRVLLSASAIGIYGSRGDEELSEESLPGDDFLAQLALEWESATAPAKDAGIRVGHLRFGVVLSSHGGALGKMLLPFKLCLGGRVGSGRQWWSWVTLSDSVRAILHVLENESLSGPVNVVAGTVPNADFARALGRVLGRPPLFPLPAFVARLAMGEMADALLLSSARVESKKLRDGGFEFQQANLESAFRELLKN